MRKSILLIISIASLISCQKSNEEILNENLKAYMQENAKDPSSYEPIETEIVDTLFVKDLYKLELDSQRDDIRRKDQDIQEYKEESERRKKELKTERYASVKKLLEKFIRESDSLGEIAAQEKMKLEKELQEMEENAPENKIAYILSNHKCRLKNGFGALDLSNYAVVTDKELNLKGLYEKKSEMYMDINKMFSQDYLN